MLSYVLIPIVLVLLALLIFSSLVIVRQQTEAIVERFGKYSRTLRPGLNFVIPVIERVAARMSLRVEQLDVAVETKTKDNVFVTVPVSVQYRIIDAQKSYYSLSDYEAQLRSYVFDRVRTTLAKMELDDAFESKDQIAVDIEETLTGSMQAYGFAIVNTLVTDINPDARVRDAMNMINAAQREKEATLSLAEAEKIKAVKLAEAEAESKRLQGEGIANQREAIIAGLIRQYQALQEVGLQNQAQELLILTQYFDTLVEVSHNSSTKTLMLPSNPGGLQGVIDELRNTLVMQENL